jgi:acyl carrier protein
MNPAPSLIEAKILQLICSELLEIADDLSLDSDLFDAGLDSMAIMQLTLILEREFGVSIPENLIVKSTFSTVRNLTNVLFQLGLNPE